MRKVQLWCLIGSFLAALGGCSTTGLQEQNKGGQEPSPPQPPRPCCINPDALRKPAHEDPGSILFKRIVYFDYDQYAIKDEYRPLIEAHARYLTKHPEIKVFVVGHTDAQGSREYNLSLGQLRAESVHKIFSLFGVAESQLEVISYGAEQPQVEGNNEAAWSQNRRAEILYK